MPPSNTNAQNSLPTTTIRQPEPVQLHQLHTSQPPVPQPMDTQKPHPENEAELNLRGGRSRLCPGRFCFCIPCPLPCDFCII